MVECNECDYSLCSHCFDEKHRNINLDQIVFEALCCMNIYDMRWMQYLFTESSLNNDDKYKLLSHSACSGLFLQPTNISDVMLIHCNASKSEISDIWCKAFGDLCQYRNNAKSIHFLFNDIGYTLDEKMELLAMKNSNQDTPIAVAAKRGNMEIIYEILSILGEEKKENDEKLCELLSEHNAADFNRTPMIYICQNANKQNINGINKIFDLFQSKQIISKILYETDLYGDDCFYYALHKRKHVLIDFEEREMDSQYYCSQCKEIKTTKGCKCCICCYSLCHSCLGSDDHQCPNKNCLNIYQYIEQYIV